MAHLVSAFTDVIAPVLLIAAAGYLLGRRGAVEPRALAALAADVLIPALMFSALSTSALSHATFVRLTVYVFAQFVILGLVVDEPACRLPRRGRAGHPGARRPCAAAPAGHVRDRRRPRGNLAGLTPPAPLAKAAQLLAAGAVAVMLLLVGAQVATERAAAAWGPLAFAITVRRLAAPIVAWYTSDVVGSTAWRGRRPFCRPASPRP